MGNNNSVNVRDVNGDNNKVDYIITVKKDGYR